jgi:hypothetical protein
MDWTVLFFIAASQVFMFFGIRFFIRVYQWMRSRGYGHPMGGLESIRLRGPFFLDFAGVVAGYIMIYAAMWLLPVTGR